MISSAWVAPLQIERDASAWFEFSMHIGPPQIQQDQKTCTLSADIDVKIREPALPPKLQFVLRGPDVDLLSTNGDAFLIALLPIAMRLGETIKISSPVSARLAHGLVAYQDILATWFPSLFQRVQIDYDTLVPRKSDPRPAGVGCTFSGGVDSFYTFWRGCAPQQAIDDFRLTHALMINGFDQIVDETDEGYIRDMERVYRPVLAEAGVQLVMLTSNMKHYRDQVIPRGVQVLSFGSPLAAGAHAVARLFGRFSLAGHATHTYADLVPMGSHPVLDHHLSTDQLQIIHDASPATRWQRIARLAEIPTFRSTVRVCTREPRFAQDTGAVVNCGACEKCVRTLITLDLLKLLDKFSTFPNKKALMTHKDAEKIKTHSTMFLIDNYKLAAKMERSDWSAVLEKAIRLKQSAKRKPAG